MGRSAKTCQWIVYFARACGRTLKAGETGIYCPGHERLYEEAQVAWTRSKGEQRGA